MSHLSPLPRSHSRSSIAASDTTYHSFRDASLDERRTSPIYKNKKETASREPVSHEMQRQDSGYESLSPRTSSQSHRRRTPSLTPTSPTTHRPRTSRPATARRTPRSGRTSRDGSIRSPFPSPPHNQVLDASSYFHFPHFPSSPDKHQDRGSIGDSTSSTPPPGYGRPYSHHHHTTSLGPEPQLEDIPVYQIPPQTTHYWTSDQTRRLEYAAIDAASNGVRGWVMRHMVPDCFVPKARRRVRFEDDSGSVVRYRLDLDEGVEDAQGVAEGGRNRKRRGWWISVRAA